MNTNYVKILSNYEKNAMEQIDPKNHSKQTPVKYEYPTAIYNAENDQGP
jgi:hypothetical protein